MTKWVLKKSNPARTCVVCKKQSVPCDNTRSFHKFPEKLDLKLKWLSIIGRFSVGKNSVICSDHFEPESFQKTDDPNSSKKLLANAVPKVEKSELDDSDGLDDNFLAELTDENLDLTACNDENYPENLTDLSEGANEFLEDFCISPDIITDYIKRDTDNDQKNPYFDDVMQADAALSDILNDCNIDNIYNDEYYYQSPEDNQDSPTDEKIVENAFIDAKQIVNSTTEPAVEDLNTNADLGFVKVKLNDDVVNTIIPTIQLAVTDNTFLENSKIKIENENSLVTEYLANFSQELAKEEIKPIYLNSNNSNISNNNDFSNNNNNYSYNNNNYSNNNNNNNNNSNYDYKNDENYNKYRNYKYNHNHNQCRDLLNRFNPLNTVANNETRRYRYNEDKYTIGFVSREDFTSEEAWIRFEKLMTFKNNQIASTRKKYIRKEKAFCELKNIIRKLKKGEIVSL